MQPKTQTCTKCSNQFRIITQEQEFLQKKNLPLPTQCPSCRQTRRLQLRGERQLFKSKCAKCSKEIIVTFDPSTVKNPILCKADYDQYFVENDPIITDSLQNLNL